MSDDCSHLDTIRDVTPSALGCEECLKSGSEWLHLRLCRTCGHVGCCDDSPNRHATKHFHATQHPIIEGYDPPEGWGWCYVDEFFFELGDRATPQNGPIPALLLSDAPSRTDVARSAYRRLPVLHAAKELQDLRIPPSDRPEALKGDRKGQCSIRINDQWRICFRWNDGGGTDIELTDYH